MTFSLLKRRGLRDGMITLPEKPGLGVDVDPAFLKKLKRA